MQLVLNARTEHRAGTRRLDENLCLQFCKRSERFMRDTMLVVHPDLATRPSLTNDFHSGRENQIIDLPQLHMVCW